MSSAQTLIKTDASCLYVSSCFYRRLYRANALKRDEAKQNGDERPAQGNSHGEASKDDGKNQDEAI